MAVLCSAALLLADAAAAPVPAMAAVAVMVAVMAAGRQRQRRLGESGSGADLGVASTGLGDVVVDSQGMTLYYFTKDEKGTTSSACTGDCLAKWPIATTTSDEPVLEGVTGEVGTIESPDGEKHLTLNGMPLYTFAQDAKPGDTAGQGVGGVWFAVAPDGTMTMIQ